MNTSPHKKAAVLSGLCLLVLLGTSNLVSAQVSGGDWTSFTLDNNNSRYQASSTVTSSNAPSLSLAWTYPTQWSITSTPIVCDGAVYFADWGGNVYSVNVADGSLNWETDLGAPISSTVLVSNGMVYVEAGPTETEVYALSQANGQVVWDTVVHGTMPSSWTSPIEYNGLLYMGTASNGIYENNKTQAGEIDALNAATGAIVWKFVTGGTAGGAGVWGSAVIDPSLNSIYFGTGNSFVKSGTSAYAYSIVSLNAMTGALNWYYKLYDDLVAGGDNDFGSTPNLFSVTLNGNTYQAVGIGNKNGDYYILDRTDGQMLGYYPIGSALGGVIGLPGFVYQSANNPEIFIPSANEHKVRSLNHGHQGVVEALIPSTDTVAWRFATVGSMIGSVAIAPGVVMFGDTSGDLYAVSTASGTQLWHSTLPYSVDGGVTIAEGYVLVGDNDNGGSAPTGLGLYAYAPT